MKKNANPNSVPPCAPESKPEGGTGTGQRKAQRIKMRVYQSPLRLDGTVVGVAGDHSSFVVEFDAPVPPTRFYRWSDTLVLDKPPAKVGNQVELPTGEYQLWEVL